MIKIFTLLAALMLSATAFSQPWEDISYSGNTNHIYDLHFANDSVGYFAAIGGVFKTTDEGKNYTAIGTLAGSDTATALYFTAADTGVIITREGGYTNFYKVTDGSTLVFTNSGMDIIKDIHFPTSQVGFAVGGYGTILVTADGGSTWTDLSGYSPYTRLITSVHFVDAGTGFIINIDGAMSMTTDGGYMWAPVNYTAAPDTGFNAIDFVDANVGFVASGRKIYTTTDGGTNWISSNYITDRFFTSVDFIDANTGIAAAETGRIAITRNGGGSWAVDTIGQGATLLDVQLINENLAYTAGQYGTILKMCRPPFSGNLTASVNEGTAPLSVTFNVTYTNAQERVIFLGDGTVIKAGQDTSFTYTYNDPGIYDVAVIAKSSGGCVDTLMFPKFIKVNATISGTVFLPDSNVVEDGKVILFKKVPGKTPFDTVFVTGISSGYYAFSNVPVGIYKILAIPNRATYPDALPTYLGNRVRWENAPLLVLTSDSFGLDIVVKVLPNVTGNGTIKGLLKEGNSFKIYGPGDPIKGISVNLIDKSSNNPIKHAITTDDPNYNFTFSNVPNGTYMVHADITGIPVDTLTEVTISDENPEGEVVMTADSTEITIEVISSLKDLKAFGLEIHQAYPNPVQDEVNFEINSAGKGSFEIIVYDMAGKKVAVYNKQLSAGSNLIKINTADWDAGAYFISIKSGETSIRAAKVVKQ